MADGTRPRRASPVLPHDWETERAVLACLVMDSTRLPEVAEILSGADFSRPQHAEVYGLIRAIVAEHGGCDLLLLTTVAGQQHRLEALGGAGYLLSLAQAAPTPELVVEYARKVRDIAVRRALMVSLREAADRAGTAEPTDEVLASARAALDGVAASVESRTWHPLRDLVDPAVDRARHRIEHPGEVQGVPTGFSDLDRLLGGLHPGRLYVLGARPAMGKTAWALNVAAHAARSGAVGFFSLEMTRDELVERLLVARARVDGAALAAGRIDGEAWSRVVDAADDLAALPLHIDDTAVLTADGLVSRAKRLKLERPDLALIVVDYVQLLRGAGGAREPREQAVAAMSRGLKELAKALAVPVLALAQLNRGVESRSDKKPVLSDLRESGAIEQDADAVAFLYRDEVYNAESPDKGIAEVLVRKNRQGRTGTARLSWLDWCGRFQDLTTHHYA